MVIRRQRVFHRMYARPNEVAQGTQVRWNGVQIEERRTDGSIYKDVARKRKLRRDALRPAALNPNWVSYTALVGGGRLPTTCRLSSDWTVPEVPSEDDFTLFFFAALLDQSLQHILQPVLQWHPTASGAPLRSWGLQTWYAGPNVRDERVSSPIIPVAPGLKVTGKIETYADGSATASFLGYPATQLIVHGLPDLTTAMMALEAYKGRGIPDHVPLPPPDEKTHAQLISTNNADLSAFKWQARGPWSAQVLNDAPSDGAVEFAYNS